MRIFLVLLMLAVQNTAHAEDSNAFGLIVGKSLTGSQNQNVHPSCGVVGFLYEFAPGDELFFQVQALLGSDGAYSRQGIGLAGYYKLPALTDIALGLKAAQIKARRGTVTNENTFSIGPSVDAGLQVASSIRLGVQLDFLIPSHAVPNLINIFANLKFYF